MGAGNQVAHGMNLAKHYLFSSLDSGQLERVTASTRERRLVRGELLFRQGDPARHFFLVCHGSVKLFLLSRSGEEKVVEVIRPDQFFAEAVMFMEGGAYPVHASALEDCELAAIESATFRELLLGSPALSLKLLEGMSRRMHGLIRQLDELSLCDATHRVVGYLLSCAEEASGGVGVRLTAPKQVIASRLGMKPETLSRILARLTERGLIENRGEQIRLLDPQSLQTLLDD
jgi:CRP-like cAMP-binding protein